MKRYIDKSALVAEIKRLLVFYSKEIEDNKENPWAMDIAKRDILQEILSFLDTLEVKEVDLEKEIENYLSSCWPNEKELHPFLGHMAKQFFELGVQVKNKAQKGEEV